jgi:xanthine dehydrogenase accessory factor
MSNFNSHAVNLGYDVSAVPARAMLTEDIEEILGFARDGFVRLGASAIVTLVDVNGGAARSVGAQMAVHGDGAFCGFVSGGCTEAAVAAEAIAAIGVGEDRFLHLGEGSPFFDIVLPCGGSIKLYIHVLRDISALDRLLHALERREAVRLQIDPVSRSIAAHPSAGSTGWQNGVFFRDYRPKTRIVICGDSIEADATARLATVSGFDVILMKRMDTLSKEIIDAYTAVALLYHDVDADLRILSIALKQKPFYLGALGSRRTHGRRCNALLASGFSAADLDRIRAPIGLVQKARDAQTLGLSILAEIAAVRNEVFKI